MKFASFSLLALGLSSSVIASPTRTAREATIVERDLASITSALSAISGKVGDLHDAINSWSGGSIDPVQSASEDLISTIKKGTKTAKESDDLSLQDAFSLTSPVQDLTKKVESTIGDLNSKKSKVVEAGEASLVLKTLKAQKAASEGLASAITSKVPEGAQGLAEKLAAGIANAVQKGIEKYKDAGSGGGSTTTGGAGETTAAPTTTGGAGETTAAPTTTTGAGTKPTTSGGVIPTGSSGGGASSSGVPTPSSSGSVPGGGSGSGSATPSVPLSTGAAGKSHVNLGLGAVAAVAAFAL